ncbi:MAG: 2-oxoglutarate oxidoreductase [Anaerolineales bacterium]|nr:2-oxoglutarate oxidoreductase [Chloroflexota bacterium]MBL6983541.1 2-oxoglutarate oxidoreductase [Anaerolineales bacterium]
MTAPAKPEVKVVFQRPESFTDLTTHYCPGCTHGVAHRLIAEVIDEMGLREKTIGVAPVGCSVFAYKYFNMDFVEAPHGRAPAMATGIKRVLPQNTVFTYQGDGDLASIGMAEIMHAAARGENITVIFINNAIYGMTGGQMAPTTLPGMTTTSSPFGRDVELTGFPIRMSEMLATMDGTGYIVRRSLHDVKNIRKAKKALFMAFETQERGLGFSMVELLSSCPTNWKIDPSKSLEFIAERMVPVFPLDDFKVNPELTKKRA